MTATAEMLYQVIPNYDVAQQIYEVANNDWTREAVAMQTRELRYLIVDPAFTEWTETVYDLYVDISEVAAALQELVDLGQPLAADVVTDVTTWAQQYSRLREWAVRFRPANITHVPHVPHRESAMATIAGLIGVDPDDLLE